MAQKAEGGAACEQRRAATLQKRKEREAAQKLEGCGAAYEQRRAITLQKEKEREAAKRSTFYFMFKNTNTSPSSPLNIFFLEE